uniref:SURP and G-patch domain-containing protein 1-like protein n=1 Tax=Ananas comosus var. bracteatus TaxID=296719 RepID=A0A6V7PK80_ANACO|nr:unnamed protein product [Ananas comosus var. bracteatus]
MDKGIDSSLFVNDGSFMEKFKQLQEKQQRAVSEEPKSSSSAAASVPLKTSVMAAKRPLDVKDVKKSSPLPASAGKLAFSLKQKSKVAVAPVKFNADEEEEEGREREIGFGEEATKRQKLGQVDVHEPSVQKGDVAPPAPSDETVRKHVTRQKNPGDTPFKFLFDKNCADYTYYEYRLLEEEKLIAQSKESQNPTSHIANTSTSTSKAPSSSHRSSLQQASNYQTPASALYGTYEESSYSGERPIKVILVDLQLQILLQ